MPPTHLPLRIDLNSAGARVLLGGRGGASGKNTLRFAVHHLGVGDSDAWGLTLMGRLGPTDDFVSLGITYGFASEGTLSGPHVIPTLYEVALDVTQAQETGSAAQTPNYARVEALVTAE